MVPRELWNTLGAAGLLCPDVDEAYGGAGTTPHVTLAMIEELSRMGFGGFASGYGIHSNIVRPISADTALRHKKRTGSRAWLQAKWWRSRDDRTWRRLQRARYSHQRGSRR